MARRLQKELESFDERPEPYSIVRCVNIANLYSWTGSVMGPADSPYNGGVFHLDIRIPKDYPFNPPRIYFRTRIYHPNIGWNDGFLSLELLGKQWSPAITIRIALEMARIIMEDPDPDNTVLRADQIEIARLCKRDRNRFNETARYWTQYYAMSNTQEVAY
jgi:ubiquitin-conjugating enzyme E2 D/E